MSKGYTNAVIMGGLGRDPEIRSTQSGKKIASFSLAVEEGYGEKAATVWYGVIAWAELADFAEKYLKKGKQVIVSGRLQTTSWDDKATGAKRTKTEVVAKDITFGDDGKSGGSGGGGAARATTSAPVRHEAPQQVRAAAPASFDDSDEIPF